MTEVNPGGPPMRRTDLGDLLGPRGGWAAVSAAGIGVLYLMLGLLSAGVGDYPLYVAAFIAMGIAAAALLIEPGDPLSMRATIIAGAGTAAGLSAVAWAVEPDGRQPALMAGGAGAMILAFLCIRGRTFAAWLSFAICLLAGAAAWWARGGLPGTQAGVQSAAGVLVMATVFAQTIRPRARRLLAARYQRLRLEAERDTRAAVWRLRRDQLARLDERARPILQAVADGQSFDADQVRECRLTEAQLRDRIRAPHLDVPALADAAWAARARGVRVVLLDDRLGADDSLPGLGPVLAESVRAIERAGSGDEVIVRLLPPGRDRIATVAVSGAQTHRLTEFAVDGAIVVTRS